MDTSNCSHIYFFDKHDESDFFRSKYFICRLFDESVLGPETGICRNENDSVA